MHNTTNNLPNNVHQLRKLGHKVKIRHFRFISETEDEQILLPQKEIKETELSHLLNGCGGKTEIEIIINGKTFNGESVCSLLDNFNKKLGVRIALGRIFKQINSQQTKIPESNDIKLISSKEYNQILANQLNNIILK